MNVEKYNKPIVAVLGINKTNFHVIKLQSTIELEVQKTCSFVERMVKWLFLVVEHLSSYLHSWVLCINNVGNCYA
jgi:hypothetical protein